MVIDIHNNGVDETPFLHGQYFIFGESDGRNYVAAKTLIAPYDIYQRDYDSGYSQGLWSRTYLYPESGGV
jgi:hypothetical protein